MCHRRLVGLVLILAAISVLVGLIRRSRLTFHGLDCRLIPDCHPPSYLEQEGNSVPVPMSVSSAAFKLAIWLLPERHRRPFRCFGITAGDEMRNRRRGLHLEHERIEQAQTQGSPKCYSPTDWCVAKPPRRRCRRWVIDVRSTMRLACPLNLRSLLIAALQRSRPRADTGANANSRIFHRC
jgi:hypothetical protein